MTVVIREGVLVRHAVRNSFPDVEGRPGRRHPDRQGTSGQEGARITSHVPLPGRFLVYMPTVHHTGVSRKIISADNRSRLRRLVSEAAAPIRRLHCSYRGRRPTTTKFVPTSSSWARPERNQGTQRAAQSSLFAFIATSISSSASSAITSATTSPASGFDNEEEYGKIVEFVSRFQLVLVNEGRSSITKV